MKNASSSGASAFALAAVIIFGCAVPATARDTYGIAEVGTPTSSSGSAFLTESQLIDKLFATISADGKSNFVTHVEDIFGVKLVKRLVNPRDKFERYESENRENAAFIIDVNGSDESTSYSFFSFTWDHKHDQTIASTATTPPICVRIDEIDRRLNDAGWHLLGKSGGGGRSRTAYEYIDSPFADHAARKIDIFAPISQENCLEYFSTYSAPKRP